MINQTKPNGDAVIERLNDFPEVATTSSGGGHPGSDWSVVWRGFFAGSSAHVPAGLYANVDPGAATRKRTAVTVHPHSTVSMDTYFGRFPASYWQRWTAVAEVQVCARVWGSGSIAVRACDQKGNSRTIQAQAIDDAQDYLTSFLVTLDRFVDGGGLWLEFYTAEQPLMAADVRWSAQAPAHRRPTSLVLCTHNRPDDCLATLRSLLDDPVVLDDVTAVMVVDQGEHTVSTRRDFPTVQKSLGEKLRYFRQPNLGGAGGFTRGLYEALAEEATNRSSGILFMDDDILLDPEIVMRMTGFANYMVEPTIVGAQMLQLLHPNRLHVSAETANFTPIEPGLPVSGALDRVDLTTNQQNLRVDADYNAWWCCLLPSEIVDDVGYPLPMFFQWDDVEFGYRARDRGHATVTLPGACVWHADFDWKDEDEWVRYFTLRNALVINSLHGDFSPRASANVVRRWIGQCLVAMKYGEAATLIKATEDFLQGPTVLDDGGRCALAEVQALRDPYQETRRHSASDVQGFEGSKRPIARADSRPSRMTAVFVKRLVWQLLGKIDGAVSIAATDAYWWHVSKFRTAIVTDAAQDSVRIRHADRVALVRLGKQALSVTRRLSREGASAQRIWQDAHAQLSSRENWTRLFDLTQ